VIFQKSDGCFVGYIPDFQINTQGIDFAEAIMMARDAIGLMGIDMEEDGEALPKPSPSAQLTLWIVTFLLMLMLILQTIGAGMT